jgi:hypothetical protein
MTTDRATSTFVPPSRRRRRIGAGLAAAALLGALLAGCSSSGGSATSGAAAPQQNGLAQGGGSGAVAAQPAAGATGAAGSATRQVVKNGELFLTVDDPLAAADRVAQVAARLGGRVDQREQAAGTGGDAGSASLTIRVPTASLEDAVTELGRLGTVSRYTEKSQDVTGTVVDLDARITAAQASVDRVQGFLEHASTTTELLSTEQALSQRQSDLEALQGQRAVLADQVAMSTLAVSLTAPGHPAIEAPGPRTFVDGLGLGWHSLLSGLRGASMVLGVLLPWLVVAAAVVVLVIAFRRWYRRRRPVRPATSVVPAGAPGWPAAPPPGTPLPGPGVTPPGPHA